MNLDRPSADDGRRPLISSRNGHPGNCLALCKSHHWAMVRHLIARAPDHRVAGLLDERRSTGERELLALSRRPVPSRATRLFFRTRKRSHGGRRA